MPDITFQSLEALQNAIGRLSDPLQISLLGERAGFKIGEELRDVLMRQPPPPSYPLRWASKKQRAWYFWMRKDKGYPIEYDRMQDPQSEDILHKWNVARKPGGAILGNSATYSPYVQSDEYQTEMHKRTGWITDDSAVKEIERSGMIAAHVMAEVESMIRACFRGIG